MTKISSKIFLVYLNFLSPSMKQGVIKRKSQKDIEFKDYTGMQFEDAVNQGNIENLIIKNTHKAYDTNSQSKPSDEYGPSREGRSNSRNSKSQKSGYSDAKKYGNGYVPGTPITRDEAFLVSTEFGPMSPITDKNRLRKAGGGKRKPKKRKK